MLVDVLSPRLFQLTATGTIVDKVDLVEFDGAFSPERQIGLYEFTDVLFTSVTASSTVNGLPTETVDFQAASQTFTQVPEPSGISVLLSAGLLCVRRCFRQNRRRRLGL
jgi:hypothetical protein